MPSGTTGLQPESCQQRPLEPTHSDPQTNPQKHGLLVYSTKKVTKPSHYVRETIRTNFNPSDANLTNPDMKEVRDGVLILSTSPESIDTLETLISTHQNTKEVLTTRRPKTRLSQYMITGVESSIKENNIAERLLSQNNLTGTPDKVTVTRTFKKTGTNTYIIEVSTNLHAQLKTLQKVFLGWMACPIRENLFLPRCTKCASIGHSEPKCPNRERCTSCSQSHHGLQCQIRDFSTESQSAPIV